MSVQAKQTFQIVALLSTILVVAIHYQSAAPHFPSPEEATWNELAQEFLLGGVARVAVPMFAFAAGLFYFRSDDGTRRTYIKKLKQRGRSVLLPYFMVASIAMTTWLLVRKLEGNPVELSFLQFCGTWLLRPPAEQLWFLRDLLVLVAIAPIIQYFINRASILFLSACAILWCSNLQPLPNIAGWHLIHTETLLFFSIGCAAVSRCQWIEKIGELKSSSVAGLLLVWLDLIVVRVMLRADFDAWYVEDYSLPSLVIHKISIVVGCVAFFAFCWKLRCEQLIRLSGTAFFVYLIHEFPLRAIIERLAERTFDKPFWFWVTTPIAILICFAAAVFLNRFAPSVMAMISGGRTPDSAARIATAANEATFRAHESSPSRSRPA